MPDILKLVFFGVVLGHLCPLIPDTVSSVFMDLRAAEEILGLLPAHVSLRFASQHVHPQHQHAAAKLK